jgi:ParB family chromosome partitioning protein
MSKKLAAKAGLVQVPSIIKPAAVPGEENAKPKTAPGSMLHFMSTQSAAIKESEGLKERLKQFDGSLPVRTLDPSTIRPSKWANRHDASFMTEDFQELKAEIASAGGNVQAIKVRPIPPGVAPSTPPGAAPVEYEIVYGHRRHRACLELGIPVAALIEGVSEQQLFVEMERENRARKDLSAWEQGQMYARALDIGLYPSNRKLADAIGRDLGDIGKALALARLPKTVIEAFSSPLDLQYRWSKPLSETQQKDPELLLARAREIKKQAGKLSAKEIFEHLTGQGVGPSNPPKGTEIALNGKRLAVLSEDAKGRAVVQFEPGALPPAKHSALARLIEDFLSKP